jgi:hypothetical protein
MMIRARSLGLKELQPAICVVEISYSPLGLGIVCRSLGNTGDMAGTSYIRTEQLICTSAYLKEGGDPCSPPSQRGILYTLF